MDNNTNTTTTTSSTDYVGPIQYEDGALAFMSTPEGRVVKNGGVWNHEYFIKDHLGNTRVVFAYTNIQDEYRATMETANAANEEPPFKNVNSSRVLNVVNHTAKSAVEQNPVATALTNGFIAGKSVGPAKMLQVKSGDVVALEVYSRYLTGTGGSTAVVAGLASAVSAALGLQPGDAAISALNTNIPGLSGLITPAGGVPKAYLFYILYNSTFTNYQFGYQLVSVASLTAFEKLSLAVTVGAGFDNGYLYTYVANESSVSNSVSVYFDDFYIRHTQAAQGLQAMQTEEYYPFGAIASSYQREGSLENKRLYQSKELIKDLGLEQYDFGPRQYDSWTCHTTTHDPHAESYYEWSPYSWAFNNPVRYGDPTGKDPIDKALGFLSAVVDNALGGITPLRSIAATYVTDAKDFNTGQDGGDVFSIVSGIMEAETGTGLTTGGTVVTVGTGGLGSEVGVPAAATGLALTAHGAVTTLAGANNLVNQKGRLNAEGKNNQGSGEGRGKNNRKPDSDATGDHTVSNDRGSTTYQKNEKNPSGFQEVKRVDTKGKADNGVPTPHVHENGKVRPARPDEIPKTDLSKNKLPNQN